MFKELFAKKPTPEEMVKKWRLEIRKEVRGLENNIRSIEMEENKVKRSIKELIKKGDKKSASISINDPGSSSFPLLSPTLFPSLLPSFPLSPCPLISILIFLIVKNILAKEMVRSKKAKERIYTSRATLNSVGMQLQQQLSMAKIAGTMAKSTQIMEMMNNLIKLPQLHASMMQMGQEMTKAGLLEEMISEVFEDDEVDEEASEEVEKIMMSLTNEVLNQGAKVPQHVPQAAAKQPATTTTTTTTAATATAVAEDDDDDDVLTARLNALRNG